MQDCSQMEAPAPGDGGADGATTPPPPPPWDQSNLVFSLFWERRGL